MDWNQHGLLIFPLALSEDAKDAIAMAFVNESELESFANERLMFDKAAPLSSDYGANETHRQISTRLFPALAAAIQAAIPTVNGGLWYVLDDVGDLLATNDPSRLSGETITHSLDWQQSGVSYAVGDLVQYAGYLYECVQTHTTAGDLNWNPLTAKSLWKRYLIPGEVLPWVQPVGASDAYPIGARVSYGGTTWVNTITANVFIPGVAGWVDENAQQSPDWQVGVTYMGDNTAGIGNGDVVLYNGTSWRCTQTHTSIATWYPGAPGVYLWSAV